MPRTLQGILAVLGRVLLCTIFFTAAVGNNIPNFQAVAGYMAKEGVPAPQVMLAGAIVFLIVGSISIVLGYKARIGAFLLLVFLALATYFFHDFWTLSDPQARQEQMIQFMKNLGLMGAMLLVIANGTGPMSLDRRKADVGKKALATVGGNTLRVPATRPEFFRRLCSIKSLVRNHPVRLSRGSRRPSPCREGRSTESLIDAVKVRVQSLLPVPTVSARNHRHPWRDRRTAWVLVSRPEPVGDQTIR